METHLGKLIWCYWKHAAVTRKTARNNAQCLLKMFEVYHDKRVPAELIPLEAVSGALVHIYQTKMVENYLKGIPKDNLPAQREARERALRTSRSVVTQARSLFSARGEIDLPAIYSAHGIELPESIKSFASAKLRGRSTKTEYQAPSDEVVYRSMEMISLMRGDRNVFLGFWLALGAGLRRSEIRNCRWEFLKVVDDQPRITGGLGKDSIAIDVPIQSKAYEAILPFVQPEGWVITERGDHWTRRLSGWMRSQGWRTRKTLHELRAFLGSRLYSQVSPVVAMRILRHKSIKTTEFSYVRYSMKTESVNVL